MSDWIDFTNSTGQQGQYKMDGKLVHVRIGLEFKSQKKPRKKKKAHKKNY